MAELRGGTAAGDPPGPALQRRIGLLGAAGFGLGAMVGTGVFVSTAIGTGLAGPAVLVSLVLAGVAAACNGLSSAELAAVHPMSGGTYEYAGRRLGPWAGFLAGWLFMAAKTTSAAATALGLGLYLGRATGLPPTALSLAVVAGATVLTLFRLSHVGAFNLVLVGVSLASLGAFILSGLPRSSWGHFTPFAPGGLRGILGAAALLFVAYAGYGRVATLGEEIEDPRRTIPRAIVLSLIVAGVLYLLVAGVAVGSFGAEAFAQAARGGAPLEDAAGPRWVKLGLTGGAGAALGSVLLNLLLGLSRMCFAMGRGGDLPAGLSRVNAVSGPFVSVLVVGAVVGGLVAVRSLVGLLSVSSFTILIYYGLTNLSALKLAPEERRVHPSVPAAGLAFCLSLAGSLSATHIATGAGILGAGVLWRLLWRRGARVRSRP